MIGPFIKRAFTRKLQSAALDTAKKAAVDYATRPPPNPGQPSALVRAAVRAGQGIGKVKATGTAAKQKVVGTARAYKKWRDDPNIIPRKEVTPPEQHVHRERSLADPQPPVVTRTPTASQKAGQAVGRVLNVDPQKGLVGDKASDTIDDIIENGLFGRFFDD